MKLTFSQNLRRYMEAAGVNQAELAARVRVDPGVVSRSWLKKGLLPNTQEFLAIASVLGVDPWMLIGSSFEEPEPPRKVAPPGRRPKSAEPFDALLKLTPRKPEKAAEKAPPPVRPPTVRPTRRTKNGPE